IQELARRRRLHPYRAELLARQARAWTIPELTAALDGLLELDVRVKGAVGATEAQRRLLFSLWLSDLVAVR
ncbi:MAG TPA: hypothetical protein VNJ28_03515, partial [Candidatus Limnocylindrales bacterium]|nr:hypothetical protein [Candidatus Limnocylindrales bacterium]